MQLSVRPSASGTSLEVLPPLTALLDRLPGGIVVLDAAGAELYRNPAAAELLRGAPAAPDGGGAMFPTLHAAGTDQAYPQERLPVASALQGVAATAADLEVVREEGRLSLQVTAEPLPLGDASTGVLLSIADVTASVRLRQLRRELHEVRTRFEVAQEKAPMGLALVGLDDRFTDVNAALCRLSGRTRGELVGTTLIDLLEGGPSQASGLAGTLQSRTEDDFHETVQILHSDGRLVTAELTAGLIRDDEGAPLHVIVLLQDITERAEHERLIGELNQALAQRGRELQQLNNDLTRSNRDLEQFAYIASHDLSEPLRSVTGYVQLLARRYQGRLDSNADEFIGFAVDGVTRMQALINDLLAYSRAGIRGEPEAVDCHVLVQTIVDATRLSRPTVRFDVEPMPTLQCEASPLRQLFENLIGNAIKFVPDGRDPVVTVTASRDDGCWRFTVADNGIGIEDRHRERIFGMFARLHARNDFPGTGIGLAICRRVVERLGGTLIVESTVGEGSRFIFSVPDTMRSLP